MSKREKRGILRVEFRPIACRSLNQSFLVPLSTFPRTRKNASAEWFHAVTGAQPPGCGYRGKVTMVWGPHDSSPRGVDESN